MLVANNGVVQNGGSQGFLAETAREDSRSDFWDAKVVRPVSTSRGKERKAKAALRPLLEWFSDVFGVDGLRGGLSKSAS